MVTTAYNDRLFRADTLRSRYHLNRFMWLQKQLAGLPEPPKRVIELGCFDGRAIELIPGQPEYYLGLDAGWEGGLAKAQEKFKDVPNIELRQCRSPEEIPESRLFDVGISLETMEHLPYPLADEYLKKLSQMIRGKLFVSVPREHGVVFPVKQAIKHLWFGLEGEGCHYSWRDYLMLTLGKTRSVERNEHKGFDERILVKLIRKYFDVESVSGLFPPGFPKAMSFAVGIVANSR